MREKDEDWSQNNTKIKANRREPLAVVRMIASLVLCWVPARHKIS